MRRRFVIGDVHGSYRALMECLRGVEFDYINDELVFLGDVTDGWSDIIPCIEEFIKIKNFTHTLGNHDNWALSYLNGTMDPINEAWLVHGGSVTKKCIDDNPDKYMMIKLFLENAKPYHIDGNILFLHAGFNQYEPIESQDVDTLMWNRTMVKNSIENDTSESSFYNPNNKYDKIFIGHTIVSRYFGDDPVTIGRNTIMMDTGCAYKGRLTIMDIDTGDFFQSTPSYLLYPDEMGRNKD